MKQLLIFIITLILTGSTKAFSETTESIRDSLQKALETSPADSSRLEIIYSLIRLEPMSPHSISNIEKLLEEADKQNNNKYQCIAMYSYVAHYFNHQDEVNTTIWADKL